MLLMLIFRGHKISSGSEPIITYFMGGFENGTGVGTNGIN